MKKLSKTLLLVGISTISSNSFSASNDILPKTSSVVAVEIKDAYLMYGNGSNPSKRDDYTLFYTPCQYVLEDYYDSLDNCLGKMDCKTKPFPNDSHLFFKIYRQSDLNSPNYDDEPLVPIKKIYGQCKFEKRINGEKRTEKAWTKVIFSPPNSQWDSVQQNFIQKPAQSVITSAPAQAIGDYSYTAGGVCGYDGFSNVTDAKYREPKFVSMNNGISSAESLSAYAPLDYIIAGQSLVANLGISTESDLDIKTIILDQMVGEIKPENAMIAGDCNASCVVPAYEAYTVDKDKNVRLLTPEASHEGKWGMVEYQKFESPQEMLPDYAVFTSEVKIEEAGNNEYGQKQFTGDLFLPGGAIFGYKTQELWVR